MSILLLIIEMLVLLWSVFTIGFLIIKGIIALALTLFVAFLPLWILLIGVYIIKRMLSRR